MALFEYQALQSNGKNTKGLIESDSLKTARQKLKKQGLMVTLITEQSMKKAGRGAGFSFFGGISGQEVALLTRQLASLIKANIPLVEALKALVDQAENPKLKGVLSQVMQDVNEGTSLSKATASHPKVFDHIFVNMIEAGETSGTLGLVLIRLAELKEAQMKLRSKVIGGMTYPALMGIVATMLMLGIFTFVIPKLAKIFESMDKKIPPLTQVLLDLSGFLVNYWYLLFGCIFLLGTGFQRYIQSPAGRPQWDAFILTLPILGPLVRMIAVTRFARTMGTLLNSGVPILTSMNIAKNLVGNTSIARAVTAARENITEGQSIAEPLKRSGEFPAMMIHMIAIGERTGELPEMLGNIATNYEEQVSRKIDAMTSLLEPLMIVFMGGSVAFIVIAIFMPLMDMMNINQR